MLANRKNIIAAVLKVNGMSADQQQEIILSLLDTNPTIILRALEIGVLVKKFKVVIINHGVNKINLIKTFREIVGSGLADAKDWSEGKTYGKGICGADGLPSGVFGQNLLEGEAAVLLDRVNRSLYNSGVKAEIVSQETFVKPLPVTWNPNY